LKVKVISYSKPTEEFIDDTGLESLTDLIAFCARVSNPSNQNNSKTTDKLIAYLLEHKHFSPLEMASCTMEVETTRDIARQMLRHRSFSFQEFSQRYANPQDMDDSFELRDARLQDPVNRQNSIPVDINNDEHRFLMTQWEQMQNNVIDAAKNAYDWAIANGIAKEQARAVLPEGNTKSRLYMAGTIRSWIHFIELRSANGTQQEHMDIAIAIAKAISKVFPLAEEYITE